ncbi:3-keto-disaccharide hydrolase [Parapedobacter koreensis]|uniref:3-keto-alpha-glucoside-1,2-lyase/3-keto-2-hydroxy-glucal hydratase domain-containing protein n=1 Tax=Parapedobacter koreensis TaxID=332977 RepID=A0A1H7MSY8_9SPHI|nr:DUF1080 domain-containing protein [Parapedobacter koreensis]SEL13785.1 protein of unknown function [Parapedobacter koreensis]
MKNIANFLVALFLLSITWNKAQSQEIPRRVTPAVGTKPPSDAIVLFDGRDFSQWESENSGNITWDLRRRTMVVKEGAGNIQTKAAFGDCQLHIEWRTPTKVEGEGQGRGNSGIFFQSRYELQVLDSYDNPTYSDGQAGSIYTQSPPWVNASRKPGEWQCYDVVFIAPRFNDEGLLESPARITVFHNGIVVQHDFEIKGSTYDRDAHYEVHGKAPLTLQDHGNPVSYRNIWIRTLE